MEDSDSKNMQAIHISNFHPHTEPFSSLRPSTIAIPTPNTRKDELLVKITYTSLQQVDLLYARGKHQNNNAKHGHVRPPFVLGIDFVGVVITGDHEKKFTPGTRVMGSGLGAFAEYITIPASSVRRIPDRLSDADAVALVGGVVSYAALTRIAGLRPGENVLVTGVPGGLGVVAAQVARQITGGKGGKVFVLGRTRGRIDGLKDTMGGHEVFAADEHGWTEAVKAATGGKGVDVVIDNAGLVEDSLRCLKYGGRIVVVGFAGRGGVMEKVPMNKVLLKGAKVIGYRYGEGIRQGLDDVDDIWNGYLDMLNTNTIKAVVHEKIYRGIESIPMALQDMEDGIARGKALINVQKGQQAKI